MVALNKTSRKDSIHAMVLLRAACIWKIVKCCVSRGWLACAVLFITVLELVQTIGDIILILANYMYR